MRIAIYPGTFDPITNGHLDVLARACIIFDQVIIAVAKNEKKSPIFSQEERFNLIKDNISSLKNASVANFDGLTMHFARKMNACAIIRGIRVISDFEYEFQMAQMNKEIDLSIETIFLMPNQDYFFTSSKMIKEVARLDPNSVARFVPANVLTKLKDYFFKK